MAKTLITDRRTTGSTYRVLRKLGKGGMAEVFLARQDGMAGLQRLTVLKKLLPQHSGSQNISEMLLDEARVAAQLTHPNIVQIYELGEEDGKYFIAMEFVDGCDLATLARIERHRQSRVPLRLTLRVISEAAMGLDYAHRMVGLDGRPLSIVHRDVSPHNILCSREGGVKVTDFGISKFVGKHQLTQVGVVKGKVQYMSPEQYRGSAVDHRSDIFSLGVVLYQLTVGRLPRVTPDGQVDVKRVADGKIPRPSDVRPEYPDDLEAIVMRALAHNVEERYPDTASLRDDLLAFARESDLLAFPKELGEYVNTLVPPVPLVVHEQSVIDASAPAQLPPEDSQDQSLPRQRDLPLVIVEQEDHKTEGPPGTEVASIHPLPAAARDGGDTEIPIDSEEFEAAVLPDETLTPFPSDTPAGVPAPPPSAGRAKPPAPSKGRAKPPVVPPPTPPSAIPAVAHSDTRAVRKNLPWGTLLVALGALVMAVVVLLYVVFGPRHGTRRTPPATVAPHTTGAGIINVLSNPHQATVSIDGAMRCSSTPCQIAGLPLGREMLLTLRAKKHSIWMQRLILTPTNRKLLLRADLTPLAPPPAKAAPALADPTAKGGTSAATAGKGGDPPKAVPGKKAPAKKAPAKKTPGKKAPAKKTPKKPPGSRNVLVQDSGSAHSFIAVDVRPWAEVWIKGQKVGHTPIQIKVPPGQYKVELKNPGRGFHKTYPVRVPKGKKVKIVDIIPRNKE